jgi:hypothetical protein
MPNETAFYYSIRCKQVKLRCLIKKTNDSDYETQEEKI